MYLCLFGKLTKVIVRTTDIKLRQTVCLFKKEALIHKEKIIFLGYMLLCEEFKSSS